MYFGNSTTKKNTIDTKLDLLYLNFLNLILKWLKVDQLLVFSNLKNTLVDSKDLLCKVHQWLSRHLYSIIHLQGLSINHFKFLMALYLTTHLLLLSSLFMAILSGPLNMLLHLPIWLWVTILRSFSIDDINDMF